MHYNMYDAFYSLHSDQHVSAAIAATFRVILLPEYKAQMLLFVSSSLHNN
jgi:hypothetical protein